MATPMAIGWWPLPVVAVLHILERVGVITVLAIRLAGIQLRKSK